MPISAAIEDYLEAILLLSKRTGSARSVDVAKFLGVTKPTVHKATHALKEQGFLLQEHYGGLTLTESGSREAERVLAKHRVIKRFLMEVLGVSEEIAEIDACKMEHSVSKETMQKIEQFISR